MSASVETIDQLIRSRRSIFPPSYIPRPIPAELITAILENANYAPTHKLTQPWRFVVFTGEGLEKLGTFLAETYRSQTPPASFSQAKYDTTKGKITASGAVIAINVQLNPHLLPEWEEVASTAAAVQNMWLSATAHGVGAYWSTPQTALEPLTGFMGLPEHQKCIGLFYMGYHNAPAMEARRTPMAEKVTWVNA